MSKEVTQQIGQIFNKHNDNIKDAIQDLFLLMGNYQQQDHYMIKQSILYAMENIHQWSNIMKYAEKWKMEEYKKGLIKRMKKRLNEKQGNEDQNIDTRQELKRLIQKYWKQRSPKRQENVYTQPISISNLMKNIKNKEEPMHIQNHNNNISQPQNFSQDSNSGKNLKHLKKSQSFDKDKDDTGDLVASLTGRPSILKRSSVIDSKKHNQQSNNSDNLNYKPKLNTRITSSNVAKMLINQNKPKTIVQQAESAEAQPQTKSQLIINKINEVFPTQKFNFGSQKKGKQSQITKKMAVSPQKFEPQKNIIKIKRPDFNLGQQNHNKNNLQFSFTNDNKKLQNEVKMKKIQISPHKIEPKLIVLKKRQSQKLNDLGQNQFDSFAKDKDQFMKPKQNQDSIVKNLLMNDSFGSKSKQKQSTPVFSTLQQNRRRSQHEMSFAMDELNMIGKQIKPKNHIKKLQYRLKMTSLQLFQDVFA